jgi:hypothetical protein
MDACANCDRIIGRHDFVSPYEYKEFLRCLIETVREGVLFPVGNGRSLENFFRPSWPEADLVARFFGCTRCGRTYQLSVDSFHGNARWEPGPELPPGGAQAAH